MKETWSDIADLRRKFDKVNVPSSARSFWSISPKQFSTGAKSGLCVGRLMHVCPALATDSRTLQVKCELKLSHMMTFGPPSARAGKRMHVKKIWNTASFVVPSKIQYASTPFRAEIANMTSQAVPDVGGWWRVHEMKIQTNQNRTRPEVLALIPLKLYPNLRSALSQVNLDSLTSARTSTDTP